MALEGSHCHIIQAQRSTENLYIFCCPLLHLPISNSTTDPAAVSEDSTAAEWPAEARKQHYPSVKLQNSGLQ